MKYRIDTYLYLNTLKVCLMELILLSGMVWYSNMLQISQWKLAAHILHIHLGPSLATLYIPPHETNNLLNKRHALTRFLRQIQSFLDIYGKY